MRAHTHTCNFPQPDTRSPLQPRDTPHTQHDTHTHAAAASQPASQQRQSPHARSQAYRHVREHTAVAVHARNARLASGACLFVFISCPYWQVHGRRGMYRCTSASTCIYAKERSLPVRPQPETPLRSFPATVSAAATTMPKRHALAHMAQRRAHMAGSHQHGTTLRDVVSCAAEPAVVRGRPQLVCEQRAASCNERAPGHSVRPRSPACNERARSLGPPAQSRLQRARAVTRSARAVPRCSCRIPHGPV